MEEKKDKRVLRIELDNDVKKVSITCMGSDEKVVMRQELNEDDLEQATGGTRGPICKSNSNYRPSQACGFVHL